jgi:hypothetical protein
MQNNNIRFLPQIKGTRAVRREINETARSDVCGFGDGDVISGFCRHVEATSSTTPTVKTRLQTERRLRKHRVHVERSPKLLFVMEAPS